MKKVLSFTTILLTLVLSLPAYSSGSCNSRMCNAPLKTIYPHANGNIYIEVDTDMTPLNCTLSQGKFLVLQDNHKRLKEIYTLLVASHFASKEITLRISEGSTNCAISYAVSYK